MLLVPKREDNPIHTSLELRSISWTLCQFLFLTHISAADMVEKVRSPLLPSNQKGRSIPWFVPVIDSLSIVSISHDTPHRSSHEQKKLVKTIIISERAVHNLLHTLQTGSRSYALRQVVVSGTCCTRDSTPMLSTTLDTSLWKLVP